MLEVSHRLFGVRHAERHIFRLHIIGQCEPRPVIQGQHVGEREPIEYLRYSVPHLDHDPAKHARVDVIAVLAGLECRPARTSDRRQRAVQGPDHLPYFDFAGALRRHISATRTFLGAHNARVAQITEDGVEKFLGDVVRLGNVTALRRFTGGQGGELHESLEPVLSFGSQHVKMKSSRGGPVIDNSFYR